ncbi:MAG TPA: hypothetical protein DDY37_02770 [Legionella sp.]|nr:hypothetical protein [Legionella sp.]
MITNNGQQVLPIYVKHGGSVILMKSLSRRFNPEQAHIQAAYQHDLDGGRYTILNHGHLKSMGVALPSTVLSLTEFGSLIERVKRTCSLQKNATLLCADANLGFPGSESVSGCFHALVRTVKPTCLVPFSEMPLCIEDTTLYLKGLKTIEGYQLALPHRLGMVSNQSGVTAIIGDLLEKLDSGMRQEQITCCQFVMSFFGCTRSAKIADVSLTRNFELTSNSAQMNLVRVSSLS